jgi:hypothetical protein
VLVPIFVGMDIARTLDWLRGYAMRARVGKDAPQDIHPSVEDAPRFDVAPGSSFRRALCAALAAGAPLMAASQPAGEPSAIAATAPASEAAAGPEALCRRPFTSRRARPIMSTRCRSVQSGHCRGSVT